MVSFASILVLRAPWLFSRPNRIVGLKCDDISHFQPRKQAKHPRYRRGIFRHTCKDGTGKTGYLGTGYSIMERVERNVACIIQLSLGKVLTAGV